MALINYADTAGDEYHKVRHQELFNNPALIEAWGTYAQLTYFPEVRPTDKILEVGCGLGNNLVHIRKMAEVYATEPSPAARDFAKGIGINAVASLEDLPTALQFDYVFLRHVLEHVSEPHAFLTELRGRLKPDGKIIIVLPTESPYSPVNPSDLDHHLYCWNRQTISNLLTDTGYKVTTARISHHNGRRVLLPLYRRLGPKTYHKATQWFGRLTKAAELIAVATP